MWRAALQTSRRLRAALAGAVEYRRDMLRLYGIPESEIAATLRAARTPGSSSIASEITTCLRRGEVEVVTRYEPAAAAVYEQFAALVRERHPRTLFSDDGTTVDEQVFALLRGEAGRPDDRRRGVVHGRPAGARLTERPGSSEVVRGGLVVYSNEAKVALAGVDPELIERAGAVSEEVAVALADGAREALGADVGVGVTGIAGPGGATADKPVGLVWLSVSHRDGRRLTRSVTLPGSRADVRDRSTTVALHLVRRLLLALPADAAVRRAGPADRRRARRSPRGPSRRAPEVRRVPAADLHVTLAFLGARAWTTPSRPELLLARGALGALRTAGALWLPPRRPGVLTVALRKHPKLTALQRELMEALAAAIGFEPERRRFRPHVTVGRVPRGTRPDRALDPPRPSSASSRRADALSLVQRARRPCATSRSRAWRCADSRPGSRC